MSILEQKAIKGFVRLCADGWEKGWHERNGGNLSYRMTDEDVEAVKPFLHEGGEFVPLNIEASNLGGEYFIATGSGKYFRNVAACPEENICIARLNPQGTAYQLLWGLCSGGKPTSEFPSHLMNHSVRKKATNGANRVIYHAHTPSLIALTYVLPLTDRDFTRVLWQSATECPVVFPGGVGVVQWMVPGGAGIALATSKLMEKYEAAVWAHHGLFCSGPDFDLCFGLMDTIEKAADIYVRACSCGQGIRQTIKDEELLAIAQEFGVQLNKELL